MGVERAMVHQFPTLVALFNITAWIGAALGPRQKSATTVFLSPIISFILLWDYGVGINKARVALAVEVRLHRLMTEHATSIPHFLIILPDLICPVGCLGSKKRSEKTEEDSSDY
ncbi:MAG: hypothetical protein Ct9H90mP26_1790 [Methanobacteriota archaeon]|nr:MAG: hypothetical protein Ct9H90mP26_1790 [Euryarchaeota archaeon]